MLGRDGGGLLLCSHAVVTYHSYLPIYLPTNPNLSPPVRSSGIQPTSAAVTRPASSRRASAVTEAVGSSFPS